MRIAVCLSGQARFIEENYEEIRSNVLDPSGNPDIYCHFWDTKDSRIGMNPEKAIELYRPCVYRVEAQKIFDTSLLEGRTGLMVDQTLVEENSALIHWTFQRVMSMWYSIKQANLLAQQRQYDCVVRCRTDLHFRQRFDPEEFLSDPDALWCYHKTPVPPQMNSGQYRYGDEFCFGNPEVMDKWCSVYDSIPKIIEESNHVKAGHFLTYHIEEIAGLQDRMRVSYMEQPLAIGNEHKVAVQGRP